jgi:lipopolysaccharide/colanic/teichoic acid biosynthesis glycosyltransferase
MQRFLDIIFSSVALLALSPLLIPVMFILRFTGEGEVFYVQQRVGKDGNMFGLLKFATMLKDSPNLNTGTITVKDDPRVLPIGKFLRKSKINELPQLLNILKGDMSIIGPRPQDKRCFVVYSKEAQEKITKLRPGLSGIGSIVFRDEESILENCTQDYEVCYDTLIAPYKGDLEIWYSENYSLYTYIVLIAMTIWVVLFSKSHLYEKLLKGLPSKPEALFNKI